jgi:hypothetical protein
MWNMKAEKKILFPPGTVEVFKTNVGNQRTANHLKLLLERLPACKINFDLEDCDNILRIKR